ncbi:MAG TPA: flagellar biosynthetic protein FliQ [Ruminococcaceae bacterium]|nr:flagellar biosynthetic protein FliQ [Oscillospiraceae bacterium]
MTSSQIIQTVQSAVYVALKISAPVLLISLLVGLVIAILQAATQIHEQTVTFLPKLVAIAAVFIIAGPWMLESLSDFTKYIFSMIVKIS